MRIGVIGHHVAPIAPPFAGGVESMTWLLCRRLAALGHEVVLYGLAGSEVPGVKTVSLSIGTELSDAARRDVSMPAPRFMQAHRAYQTLLLDLVRDHGRFDILHSHSLHYLPALLAELLSTPLVLTLHCPPTPWLEAALTASPTTPTAVTVSESTSRLWQPIIGSTHVIPNGIDLDDWSSGPGGRDLVWAGRIVPEKAPHLAIDAARLSHRRIYLAGPVMDPEYWSREVSPRLGTDACFVGHLEHSALRELIARSAALVVTPVWDEPFCLVAAEAMAVGTPVAGFARGGLPEVVNPGGGVLTDSRDLRALSDAIAQAITIPRGLVRRQAEQRLNIRSTTQSYLALYRRLTEAPHADAEHARRFAPVGRLSAATGRT